MTTPSESEPLLYCSFCNRDSKTVSKLIAGPAVFICDACVEKCNEILAAEAERSAEGETNGP